MENGLLDKQLGVGLAVLVGHLVITLPVLIFISGITLLGFFIVFFLISVNPIWIFGFLLLGFIVAWTWWSLLTPKWRSWAHKKGVSPDELQKWAALTGLVWPKGWIFEKTEFKWNNDKE